MTIKNQIDKVLSNEATKNIWRGDYLSEEWILASALNKILFDIPLNQSQNCHCIEDLYFMLKNPKVIIKIKNKMEQLFRVKKDAVITSFDFNAITEHSSDAECIAALKKQPSIIKYFSKHPENYLEMVNEKKPIFKVKK